MLEKTLRKKIKAERFNLTNEPNTFVENETMNELLKSDGMDDLRILQRQTTSI
ncbi:arsenic metallochaperone ArsD family protein [Lysinibacillus sp. NPDC097231]|uniref:arsenic metallochaperone ArsD family protein n=1 Tax=Lysinibacillus sp. NPDC097231 TaxID=3364142 RepID=UPI003808D8D1